LIYAIGDIHGENGALKEMLAKLPVQPSDLVIFLGDAINHGPDPFDCVEQILAFDRSRKVFYSRQPWTLPFYITDTHLFTHVGWDLMPPLSLQPPSALRWGKVKGDAHPYWAQTVVRGHTPFPKVMFARTKQYIGVDTGCSMGGLLSAVALPTNEVFTARPASFQPDWYARLQGASYRK